MNDLSYDEMIRLLDIIFRKCYNVTYYGNFLTTHHYEINRKISIIINSDSRMYSKYNKFKRTIVIRIMCNKTSEDRIDKTFQFINIDNIEKIKNYVDNLL